MAVAKGVAAPVTATAGAKAQAIAASLLTGERKAVLLGDAAARRPAGVGTAGAGPLDCAGMRRGVELLGEAANSVAHS